MNLFLTSRFGVTVGCGLKVDAFLVSLRANDLPCGGVSLLTVAENSALGHGVLFDRFLGSLITFVIRVVDFTLEKLSQRDVLHKWKKKP